MFAIVVADNPAFPDYGFCCLFFFQAEDGIRDLVRSRGLGDVYKRQDRYYFIQQSMHKTLSSTRSTKNLTEQEKKQLEVRRAAETNAKKAIEVEKANIERLNACLLYTSPSPRDRTRSRMPSSA